MESPSMVRGEEFVLRRQIWVRSPTKETHIWAESHIALQVTPTVCFRGFHDRSHPSIKESTGWQGQGAIFKWWLMLIIMWLFVGSISANRYVASGERRSRCCYQRRGRDRSEASQMADARSPSFARAQLQRRNPVSGPGWSQRQLFNVSRIRRTWKQGMMGNSVKRVKFRLTDGAEQHNVTLESPAVRRRLTA